MKSLIKNYLHIKYLLFFLLLLSFFFNYKVVFKEYFSLILSKTSVKLDNRPEDLDFFNNIIKKYFNENEFSSPTFFFKPYELGMHILGDGYRLDNFRVQKKYLIKNNNSLLNLKVNNIVDNGIRVETNNISNIHGILIDIKNFKNEVILYIKNNKLIIDPKKLISCDEVLNKKNFFALDKEKQLKKIVNFQNCKFYQFTNSENYLTIIQLMENDEIFVENVSKIELYGNNLDIDPYVIMEVDPNNYNLFYAESSS